MLGMVMLYSPSSGLSRKEILLAPSIMLAAELPKNLDLGLSSPRITTLWSIET